MNHFNGFSLAEGIRLAMIYILYNQFAPGTILPAGTRPETRDNICSLSPNYISDHTSAGRSM